MITEGKLRNLYNQHNIESYDISFHQFAADFARMPKPVGISQQKIDLDSMINRLVESYKSRKK